MQIILPDIRVIVLIEGVCAVFEGGGWMGVPNRFHFLKMFQQQSFCLQLPLTKTPS